MTVDRGIALHKMIRLLTASLGGDGYLNFMGNEFGHPEWIDFPREGNGWSHHYCRRQWSLVDDPNLHYCELNEFDKTMIALLTKERLLTKDAELLKCHQSDKVLIFRKGSVILAFNFNPTQSFEGYFIPTGDEAAYEVLLSSDDQRFGGHGRVDTSWRYQAKKHPEGHAGFPFYLPSRSAVVFKKKSRS